MILTGKAAKFAQKVEEEISSYTDLKEPDPLTEDEQIILYTIHEAFSKDELFRMLISTFISLYAEKRLEGISHIKIAINFMTAFKIVEERCNV